MAITITPDAPVTLLINSVMTPITYTATGGVAPYSYSALTLPAGLAIDPVSGELTGTPTVLDLVGSFATIEAEDANTETGSLGVMFTIVDELLIEPSVVDLVTLINVPITPSTYTVSLGTPPYTWNSAGSFPPGLSPSPLDEVLTISGTPTALGVYNFSVIVDDSSDPVVNTWYPVKITVIDGNALAITTTELELCQSTASTLSLAASGGTPPYSFTATNVPDGLTLNTDGTITGSATTPAIINLDVTVTDFVSDTANELIPFSISQTPVITGTIPVLRKNVPFTFDMVATVGSPVPITWEVLGLPAWASTSVSLDTFTLTISGTPDAFGITPISIQART